MPSRYCVVVADDTDAVAALAAEVGATMTDGSRTDPAGKTVAVILFADGNEAVASRTGTCFGSAWAAREHARHKASGDERTWDPDDLRHESAGIPDSLAILLGR